MDLTAAEREVILLLRSEPVTTAELVTVPRVYALLFRDLVTSLTRAQRFAEYLGSQHVTPE